MAHFDKHTIRSINAFQEAGSAPDDGAYDINFDSLYLTSQPTEENGEVNILGRDISVSDSVYVGSQVNDFKATVLAKRSLIVGGSVYSGNKGCDTTLMGRNVTVADSVYGGSDGDNTRLYIMGDEITVGGSIYSNAIIAANRVCLDASITSKWRERHEGIKSRKSSLYSGSVIISVEEPKIPSNVKKYGAKIITGDEARQVLSLGPDDFRKFIERLLDHNSDPKGSQANKDAIGKQRSVLQYLQRVLEF